MPIYEFHCTACRRDSEMLVRTSEWKGTLCPHCGSPRLAKKLSIFASGAASQGGEACPEAGYCQRDPAACSGCCGGAGHSH